MGDSTTFGLANESQVSVEPFVSKQWSYIIDSNSGVYQSSQVTLDTSSWSNSGKFVNWAECYLTFPMVMVAYPTSGAIPGWDAWDASWLVGIKNGHQQLIDSFSCDVQNSSVIQLTRYTNLYTTYRMMTSMSATELKTIAPSIGFFPDTSDSFDFTTSTSAGGVGSQNNLVWGFEKLYPNNSGFLYPTSNNAAAAYTLPFAINQGIAAATNPLYTANLPTSKSIKTLANVGLYNRIKSLIYNPAILPYSALLNADNTKVLLKNYYYSQAGSIANIGPKVWSYIAKIRLKDLSSVFEQLGLVRGLYMRFIFNVNTGIARFAVDGIAATATTPAYCNINQSSANLVYGTLPFQVTSFAPGQPATTLPAFCTGSGGAPYEFAVQNSIGSLTYTDANNQSVTIQAMAQQVRLYGPLIVMSATAESQFLSLNPTKKIIYRDIYEYNANNIDANGDFNVLLSNGLVNTKALIVMPFFTKTSNGTGFNTSPLASAFCSEPGTTSPLCAISNYNVALAGVNLYQNNYRYDWESFITELNMINSLNANLLTGLNSGLITEYDYSNIYRYYVTDLSRRIAAEDTVPKSLQILGSNLSSRAVDLYCFVEVEKSLVIDTSSGERLE